MNKSARDRRQTLESLRSTTSVGPLIHGLNATGQLLIAEFYNRRICQRFRNTLCAHGISSSTKSNRIKVLVYVRNADRREAFELLDENHHAHPDKRPVARNGSVLATTTCSSETSRGPQRCGGHDRSQRFPPIRRVICLLGKRPLTCVGPTDLGHECAQRDKTQFLQKSPYRSAE